MGNLKKIDILQKYGTLRCLQKTIFSCIQLFTYEEKIEIQTTGIIYVQKFGKLISLNELITNF